MLHAVLVVLASTLLAGWEDELWISIANDFIPTYKRELDAAIVEEKRAKFYIVKD